MVSFWRCCTGGERGVVQAVCPVRVPDGRVEKRRGWCSVLLAGGIVLLQLGFLKKSLKIGANIAAAGGGELHSKEKAATGLIGMCCSKEEVGGVVWRVFGSAQVLLLCEGGEGIYRAGRGGASIKICRNRLGVLEPSIWIERVTVACYVQREKGAEKWC